MWTLISRRRWYSAHLARINSSFLISTPSVLRMLSECCQAGMLSGPAVLRQKIAFSTSSNDDGLSSFTIICSFGGSSRKSMLVMWTLFSRLCRYSANLARINSLFLIRMPSVLRMLSGGDVLLSLRQRMALSTPSKDGGSSCFGMIGCVSRSSKKRGSVKWTLFSRLCWYSTNQARINYLFVISTPLVLRILSECCQAGMLSQQAVMLYLRQKMALYTS